MKINDLIKKCNIDNILDTLISLHRVHYHEPGYVFDSKIKKLYRHIIEELSRVDYTGHTLKMKIIYNSDQGIYDILVDGVKLRDIAPNVLGPDNISMLSVIEVPKSELSHEAILLEILTEITFITFPNNT